MHALWRHSSFLIYRSSTITARTTTPNTARNAAANHWTSKVAGSSTGATAVAMKRSNLFEDIRFVGWASSVSAPSLYVYSYRTVPERKTQRCWNCQEGCSTKKLFVNFMNTTCNRIIRKSAWRCKLIVALIRPVSYTLIVELKLKRIEKVRKRYDAVMSIVYKHNSRRFLYKFIGEIWTQYGDERMVLPYTQQIYKERTIPWPPHIQHMICYLRFQTDISSNEVTIKV